MFIKQCSGYELEKEQSNSPEEFFNRSEVTFIEDGEEKTIHVLYLRYFDEIISKFTPYKQNPIFNTDEHEVTFKEVVAIACLLRNQEYKQRKRVYINSEKDIASVFQGLNFDKFFDLIINIKENRGTEVHSTLEFSIQPA